MSALPQTIFIIRHGEKPAAHGLPQGITAQGQANASSLTPRGWQRAGALVELFAPRGMPTRADVRRPGALFSPSYDNPAVHRPHQTITPLSQRLRLPIATPGEVGQEADLVKAVLAQGRDALICWEHDHIPLIAGLLPLAPGTVVPQPWPGDRFDIIWRFDLDVRLSPPAYRLTQLPQRLLAGDRNSVIVAGPSVAGTDGLGLN